MPASLDDAISSIETLVMPNLSYEGCLSPVERFRNRLGVKEFRDTLVNSVYWIESVSNCNERMDLTRMDGKKSIGSRSGRGRV
jgi:hypothetical protein